MSPTPRRLPHRLWRQTAVALVLLMVGIVHAAPTETPVDYQIDGTSYRGYAIYDASVKTPRPLVVLVPNWLGANAANRKQAAEIAGKDYVVFVADMFGVGKLPANTDEAGKAVGALYADRALLRSRVAAAKTTAVETVKARKLPADLGKVAAIGFCFGGASVLELARSGDNSAAVVSFHGNLSLQGAAEDKPVTAKVLALHGDADPFVPAEQVDGFLAEMRAGRYDWELVRYGGAVHSFTDPDANWAGKAEYNPKVAKRAFARMKDFLAEAFATAR